MPNYNFSHKRLKAKTKPQHASSKKVKLPFSKQEISPVKLALVALGILLGVLILGKLLQGLNNFLAPFTVDSLGQKEYSWDGQTAINVVLKDKEVSLLHYDPAENKAIILKIPGETYMDVPGGFGNWPIRSIYGLGQVEKPPQGAHLLKLSIKKLLGLPIDGVIVSNSSDDQLSKDILAGAGPLSLVKIMKNMRTDLSPQETVGLLWNLSDVRSDKLIFLDLAQSNITQSKLLADSSRVLGINNVNLNLFIKENLSESKIQEEAISVAVFNATNHALLAQEASRIVTNIGADVIIVGNTQNAHQKTVVIAASQEESLTLKRVQQVFAPDCLRIRCQVKDDKVNNSRAQINIVLGDDFYEHFVKNSQDQKIIPEGDGFKPTSNPISF